MWVKICGIGNVVVALDVAKLAPDAIGLNFYANTPRAVSADVAAEIVGRLPSASSQGHQIEPIGLFVNHSVAEVMQICTRCRIRTIQLHGDEPVQFLAELQNAIPEVRIVRAYRLGPEGRTRLPRR